MHVLVTADTMSGSWTYTRELVTGLVTRGVRVTRRVRIACKQFEQDAELTSSADRAQDDWRIGPPAGKNGGAGDT